MHSIHIWCTAYIPGAYSNSALSLEFGGGSRGKDERFCAAVYVTIQVQPWIINILGQMEEALSVKGVVP